MLRRREIRSTELRNIIFRTMTSLREGIEKGVREYITVEDFAPEEYKVGSTVVDPITGLRGEVIGYHEESILIPVSRSEGS